MKEAIYIGRISLASGNCMRICVKDKGVYLMVDDSSKVNGDIEWLKQVDHQVLGLGYLAKKKKKK